jgi:hypothetical protein
MKWKWVFYFFLVLAACKPTSLSETPPTTLQAGAPTASATQVQEATLPSEDTPPAEPAATSPVLQTEEPATALETQTQVVPAQPENATSLPDPETASWEKV